MSNDSAIKRFTYDWLIHFTELHPFQPYDYQERQSGPFNRLTSKYAAISPMFASLMTRHMPYLFYGDQLHVSNRHIVKNWKIPSDCQNFKLPSPKKYSIYVFGVSYIKNLTPDLFAWFKDNLIIFYGEHLFMTNKGATIMTHSPPEMVERMLPHLHSCYCEYRSTITLTEPVAFSEICPFIAQYKDIALYTSVIYGTNFTNIARKYRFAPYRFYAYEQDMSDNVMLEMVDYFLSLPNRHSDLDISFPQSKPYSLNKIVVDKIGASGTLKQYCSLSQFSFFRLQVEISKNI